MLRKLYSPEPSGGGAALATPPAPAAPSAPASPATATPDKSIFERFDDFSPGTPSAPAAKPAGTPPPKPDAGKPAPKPAAPTGTPAAKPEVEFDEVEGVQVPKGMKMPQDPGFRSWGLNGYKQKKELERQLAEKSAIEAEFQELKATVPKTLAEKQAIESQLAALKKDHEAVMGEFKIIKYEASPEYKSKYDAPYRAAINHAVSEVKELQVREEKPDPNGELDDNGNPKMVVTKRPATIQDFEKVFNATLGAAADVADELFGRSASIVLGHRQKIRDLATAAQVAIAEYKDKHVQIEKEQNERATLERGQAETMWADFNKALSSDERAKDLWGETGDSEIDTELKRGLALADKRFSNEYNALPLKDKVALDALIRHRVASSFKLAKQNSKLKSELEQAKADLAELRGSSPGAPLANGEQPPGADDDSPMTAFQKKFG